MSIARDLGLALLITCLCIILLELGAQAAGVAFQASFFTQDAVRGYALRPFAHGWYLVDGRAYARINSAGYHDQEHSVAKPPGVLRIAVLGSSYVAGLMARRGFVSVLESALNCLPSRKLKVETLNFGVDAYSAMQSYLTLNRDVWKYRPDIILFTLSDKDPLEDYRGSANNLGVGRRPYFEVVKGDIVPDRQTQLMPPLNLAQKRDEDRENDLMNRSQLALGLRAGWSKLYGRLRGAKAWGPGAGSNFPVEPPKRILEVLFSDLKRDAQAHGAELWVVTFGEAEQENPDPKVRAEYQRFLNSPSGKNTFSDARMAAMARAAGLPVIELSPILAAYAEQHHAYLHGAPDMPPGIGHWNELGDKIGGETIASELERASPLLR